MNVKVPHTLALLFILMIAALIMTWVVPSGEFETVVNDAGREVVVPGSYETIDEKEYLPITALFTVIPKALADAQGIIFFVLIIGGSLAVIRETGAIDALLGKILNRFGDQPGPLLFTMMMAFAVASATLGMAEEYIPFAIILVSLCIALNMDAIAAIGTMVIGYGIGYGVAVLNPFTLLIAQDIAELEPTSGMWYRLILAVPLIVVGFHHVWKYARCVQNNPDKSLMKGIEQDGQQTITYPGMDLRKKIVLLITIAALVMVVVGIALWHWYIIELGAVFFAMALFAGISGGLGVNKIASVFTKGAAELTGTALLIGFARSIARLMEDAEILHTVVNALATPLSFAGSEIAAVGMLFVQSILNFFIPSGSGQAFVTMPLMAPIGDLVGVSRQVSVLAFQIGDGLMNMIVPTNAVLMGILGLANIPYERWFRFIYPLIIKLLVVCSVGIAIAVWIGYS